MQSIDLPHSILERNTPIRCMEVEYPHFLQAELIERNLKGRAEVLWFMCAWLGGEDFGVDRCVSEV